MPKLRIAVLAERHRGLAALMKERDRRYAELRAADQRALEIKAAGDKESKRIKEEGDNKALDLARDIQIYKDTKANELREQIASERGLYATHAELATLGEKLEAQMKPVTAYIASQQGKSSGLHAGWGILVGAVGLIAAVFGIVIVLVRK